MADTVTVGELCAAFLERCGVRTVFGVISIHNMPILDAIGRRGQIRFVPARGEAGATNMADAYARVGGGLGVVLTSTGTGAGNAAGALVEAQTAGTPLLHLTGQIERANLDRNQGSLHEARDQPAMLRAVSKAVFRIWSPETALGTLQTAVRCALTAPPGPVSVELPIDVQQAKTILPSMPADLAPAAPAVALPDPAALDRLAERLAGCRRPLLWLGGGARHAGAGVRRLVELGFGVVTSTQGRGVLAEDDPRSLGAFTSHGPVEDFYQTCDALLVVGSRLRGNETLRYTLRLPRPLLQIDADPQAAGRSYPTDAFVCADSALALSGLAERLTGRLHTDAQFHADLAAARAAGERMLRDSLGPYQRLVDALQAAAGREFSWVRDVTISNSTWGNRLLKIFHPRAGVHALGGGIGQGLPMAVGAALAAPDRKTLALVGDGGLQLCLGELASAAQERAELLLMVMNDRGYGVIKNIQDARYAGRRYYADLLTPDFAGVANAVGVNYRRLDDIARAPQQLCQALATPGPVLLDVDMTVIGPFAQPFAGPPVRDRPKP